MNVSVCGKPCPRVNGLETRDSVICTLPEMHSVFSVEQLRDTVLSTNLMNDNGSAVYASDPTLGEAVFDGDTSSSFGAGATNCYVGMKVASPSRMIIERIRFMISEDADPDAFLDGVF